LPLKIAESVSTPRTARTWRHLRLAGIAAALIALCYALTPPPDVRHRASMAAAYVAMIFLAWSLLLGPLNVLRSRPNPISFNLRRDVSIWAGLLALLHTAVGLTVHLRGRMWMYFFAKLHPLKLQKTQFGFANYTGLIAALLFLGLLLISNDLSLRSFGTKRWKTLQRMAYVAFALTLVHGWAFQMVENRKIPWMAVFWFMAAVALVAQLTGFFQRRKKPKAQR
jgi:sulfoxide reductase heme-binding subunit YedZ